MSFSVPPLTVVASALVVGALAALHPAGPEVAAPAERASYFPGESPVLAPAEAPAPKARTAVGVVVSERVADVAPLASGRLVSLSVKVGARVAQGDEMGRLDTRAARMEVAKGAAAARTAEIEVARARAEATNADERASAADRRFSEGLGSGDERTKARFERETARLRLDALTAQFREKLVEADRLKALSEDGILRAPFAGLIARCYAAEGATVGPQRPILRLVADGSRIVRFAMPETCASTSNIGRLVNFESGGRSFAARVERIAPEVDLATHTVVAEASLAASDATALLEGATVVVTLSALPCNPGPR